jgi:hypothetical protein
MPTLWLGASKLARVFAVIVLPSLMSILNPVYVTHTNAGVM